MTRPTRLPTSDSPEAVRDVGIGRISRKLILMGQTGDGAGYPNSSVIVIGAYEAWVLPITMRIRMQAV